VNTEITERIKEWLFYDAECAICRGWVQRLRKRLHRQGIGVAPLQAEWVGERLGLAPGELPEEMKLLTSTGEIFGGADAILYLARYFWWGWGLRVVAHLPGARFVLRRAYAWLARHRYCLKGGCKV
jgi:predicted DCC family thiol-disulfide oxidoreductase YuxK